MNEQLQNVLIDMINSVASAKDFVLAELPDVIEQLLMWKMVNSLIVFLLAVGFSTAWFWAPKIFARLVNEDNKVEAHTVLAIIGGVVGNLIALIIIFDGLGLDWLQILIAPKVYLLEYAAKMAL